MRVYSYRGYGFRAEAPPTISVQPEVPTVGPQYGTDFKALTDADLAALINQFKYNIEQLNKRIASAAGPTGVQVVAAATAERDATIKRLLIADKEREFRENARRAADAAAIAKAKSDALLNLPPDGGGYLLDESVPFWKKSWFKWVVIGGGVMLVGGVALAAKRK